MEVNVKLYASTKLAWLQHSVFENSGIVVASLPPGKTPYYNNPKKELSIIFYLQDIPKSEAKQVIDDMEEIIRSNHKKNLLIYCSSEVLDLLQTVVTAAIAS